MSMPAVTSYIRTLREGRAMTRPVVARMTGLSVRTIEDFETQHQDMRFSNICLLLHAIRGVPEHLHRLFLDDAATEQDGRELAEALVQSEAATKQMLAPAVHVGDEQARAIRAYVRTLRDQIGISVYPLADGLSELFLVFRDWEGDGLPGRHTPITEHIATYVWTVCEDLIHLHVASVLRPDQGRRLALHRSLMLSQSHNSPEPILSPFTIGSQLAILQQRARVQEKILLRLMEHWTPETGGRRRENGDA